MATRSSEFTQTVLVTARKFFTHLSFAHLAIAQGIYFAFNGLWPVVSIDSFMAVTGPKTDLWLVKTVGLLLGVIGVVLLIAGIRWRVSMEILILGAGSAAALAAIELVYVSKGVISPIYLLDTLVELTLLACWIYVRIRAGRSPEVCIVYDPTLT